MANNTNVGLPEVYLSPSKRNLKKLEDSIWKIDNTQSEEEECNSSYKSDTKSLSAIQHITKGMRGETPGSDSPQNSATSTNISKNVNISKKFVPPTSQTSAKSSYDPERDKFIKRKGKKFASVSQRSPVDGALSNEDAPYSKPSISLNDKPRVMSMLPRNSPTGNSNETILNLNTGEEDNSFLTRPNSISKLVRPPALGQSEDADQMYKGSRKDLGSSDGEDSSAESIKPVEKDSIRTFIEGLSLGSQSENTDSTTTVLDMKREPVQGCEDTTVPKSNNTLSKPNFIVGGAISPRVVSKQKVSIIEFKRLLTSEVLEDQSKLLLYPNSQVPLEQDDSLTSMISVESTQHPESSECFTSPSGISVSSVASSKKLEWDSSADVGYASKTEHQECLAASLSTLERIAIGNYASVLRTEPEGKGTNQIKGKFSKKLGNNSKEKVNFSKSKENASQKNFNIKPSSRYLLNSKKGVHLSYVNTDRYRQPLSSDEEYINKSAPTSPGKASKRLIACVSKRTLGYKSHENHGKNKELKYPKNKTCSLSALHCSSKQEDISADIKFLNSNQLGENLSKGIAKISSSNVSTNSSTIVNSISSLPIINSSQKDPTLSDKAENSFENKQVWPKSPDAEVENSCVSSSAVLSNVAAESNDVSTTNDREHLSIKNETLINSDKTSGKDNTAAPKVLKTKPEARRATSSSVLQTLAKKLKFYVDNLMESGAIEKFDDYNKLHDYVEFVALPSTSDEEAKLKQSIADIIMRLFGDMNDPNMESTSSQNSEECQSRGSSSSSTSLNPSNTEMSPTETVEVDKGSSKDSLSDKEKYSSSNGNVVCIPYRPSSATRTYYITAAGGELGPPNEVADPKSSKRLESGTSSLEKSKGNSANGSLNGKENSPRDKQHEIDTEKVEEISLLPTSSNKVFYQDWHGTYHVAHQPPGYSSCLDSHQSDSTSENEARKENDDGPNEVNLNLPVWSSTGSESAYETIRERHRNVAEALASSFEFYSTSPRDARVLGYVSPDNEDQNNDSRQRSDKSSSDLTAGVPPSYKSSERENISSSSSHVHKKISPRKAAKRRFKSCRKHQGTSSQNYAAPSESDAASSTVSMIQLKKQKYVKKMRKYISTLERLERALQPSCDNLATTSNNLSSESNMVVNDLYQAEKVVSDIASSISGRFVSSEYVNTPQSSFDATPQSSLGAENTFVKLQSSTTLDRNEQEKLFSSLSQSPRETSTLRSHRIGVKGKKKIEMENCHKNENFQVSSFDFGHISDFKKLMASRDAPGETRPYRYLLKNNEKEKHELHSNEERVSDVEMSNVESSDPNKYESFKTSTNDELKFKTYSSGEQELHEIFRKPDVLPPRPKESIATKPKESYEIPKSSETLVEIYKLPESRITEPHVSLRNQEPIENRFQEPIDNRFQEPIDNRFKEPIENRFQDSFVNRYQPNEDISTVDQETNDGTRKGSIDSIKKQSSLQTDTTIDYTRNDMTDGMREGVINGHFKNKETKDFGQIFPNESFLQKPLRSVSVQTGQSLLELKIVDQDSSYFPPVTQIPGSTGSSSLHSLVPSPPLSDSSKVYQSSTLEEMSKRIQKNAEKIEEALAAYNKSFASAPNSALLPKSYSSMNEHIAKSNNKGNYESSIGKIYNASNKNYDETIDNLAHSRKYSQNNETTGSSTLRSTKVIGSLPLDENIGAPLPTPIISVTPEEKELIVLSKNNKSLCFTVPVESKEKNQSRKMTPTQELIEFNKKNQIMTLQEALLLAKPSYVKEAEKRRQKIHRKQLMRQQIQSHNREVMAELPDNIKTPTVLQKFLVKPGESPVFSYREIRKQNQRLYQLLPEAQRPQVTKKKEGMSKGNRLMAKFYSQKLRKKLMSGKISHGHREVVTPLR